jgi:hypothetical protein
MRKFALWTAGSKAASKKRKAPDDSNATANKDTGEASKKKTKYAVAAFENRDVCQGMFSTATVFGLLYSLIVFNPFRISCSQP